MSDAKIPPGPWKWTCPASELMAADERLVDANGKDVLAPSEWLIINPAARPVIEASAELLELLRRWNVSIGTAEEMEQLESETTAMLKRLGATP